MKVETESEIDVGKDSILLFDHQFTAWRRNIRLTLNPPRRDSAPVLIPDRPWEVGGIMGDSNLTVIDDNGRLRMWYMIPFNPDGGLENAEPLFEAEPAYAADLDEKTRRDIQDQGRYMLCYAESTDGATWEKPDVGLYSFQGSRRNNMLFAARLGATVFIDPTAPPQARYKMIYGGGPRLPHYHRHENTFIRMAYTGIYGATSCDGLRWTPHLQPIMPWYTDSTNVCYWDDRIERYVAFVRTDHGMILEGDRTVMTTPGHGTFRIVSRAESDDFRSFPSPTDVLVPTRREREPHATGLDYYNSAALKYPFAESAYFLFPSYFYHEQDALDVHVATSRDGRNYRRWSDPWLRLGPAGAFDARGIYMGVGVAERGDDLWMYYRGTDGAHGQKRGAPRQTGIGRVRLRRDGFISQDAGPRGGELVTVPLKTSGRRLQVNVDASAGGCLRVALLDQARTPIPGYADVDAEPVWHNRTRVTVNWKAGDLLPALDGRPIRLRFTGHRFKLYSFRFTD